MYNLEIYDAFLCESEHMFGMLQQVMVFTCTAFISISCSALGEVFTRLNIGSYVTYAEDKTFCILIKVLIKNYFQKFAFMLILYAGNFFLFKANTDQHLK